MVRRRPGTASKASSRRTGRRRQPENREGTGSSFRVLLRKAIPFLFIDSSESAGIIVVTGCRHQGQTGPVGGGL